MSSNGGYTVQIRASGFIHHDVEVVVNCTAVHCHIEKLVALSPPLPPGQTRILLTWDHANPEDLDIYIMAIKRSDLSLCKTCYSNMNGCPSISQDLDNASGGLNGAETMTLLNNTVNSQYKYLIAIEDFNFENNGTPFLNSGARISITNGIQTSDYEMKGTSIESSAKFYLFGCLDVSTDGNFQFNAAPEGTFFNGNDESQWSAIMAIYCTA